MDIREHSGYCCGIRTIYGFDGADAATLTALVNNVDMMDGVNARQNRLIEVVLSQRQMDGDRAPAGGWPPILQGLGFILVNRFQNANSGRQCYVFHRNGVDNPLPVEHPLWMGGVGSQAVPRAALVPAAPVAEWRAGDRVRYSDHGAAINRRGQTGTLTRRDTGPNERWHLDWDNGEPGAGPYSARYFERIVDAAAPRALYTSYHNVLRGGRGAGFATIEGARTAAPRARSIDKLEVMSDGELRWTEGVV